jgi:hypothetical protein
MPPYYFIWLLLVSLHRFERTLEPLVKLREVARVSQHRLNHGFKENSLGKCRPTATANDFDKIRVVRVARKVSDCNFYLAELSLESLNLIRGCFGL